MVERRDLVRRRVRRRPFADTEVAEVTLGAFRFKTDIAFTRFGLAAAGDFLTIHREPDNSVAARDVIVIPFAGWLRAALAWEAAHPAAGMRAQGFKRSAMNREHIAVACVVVGASSIEDLNLNGAREGDSGRRDRITPDEQSGISTFFHVAIIQLQLKVLVLLAME